MIYAIVSGATQGIGKSLAEKLLKEGCSVAICSRNKNKLDQLKIVWQELYPQQQVIAIDADLSNFDQTERFAKEVLKNFPQIDILVNNAGQFVQGNIADETQGKLEQLMEVNLYSAYYLTKMMLPNMKTKHKGHIFNMCSVASLQAYPNGGAYSITKYALLGFNDNLREELKHTGIKVTAVCPGATYTPAWSGSNIDPDRIMEARDIADIIWSTYLLSPQANVDRITLRPVKGDL